MPYRYGSLTADPHYTGNLPFAYAEVELEAERVCLAEQSELACPRVTAKIMGRSLDQESPLFWRARIASIHSSFFESFIRVFEAETLAGRFEITELDNFLLFIADPRTAPHLGPLLNRSSEVFELVFETLEFRPSAFVKFIESHQAILSTERLDKLWEGFKATIMLLHIENWPSLWPDWTTEQPVPLEAIAYESLTGLTRNSLLAGLSSFFGCFESSPDLIEELSLMIPKGYAHGALRWRLHPKADAVFKNPLGYDFEPWLLKDLHPEFFTSKIKAAKVDPTVVSMLLDSWSGDFESLLESAKSLSAESA